MLSILTPVILQNLTSYNNMYVLIIHLCILDQTYFGQNLAQEKKLSYCIYIKVDCNMYASIRVNL